MIRKGIEPKVQFHVAFLWMVTDYGSMSDRETVIDFVSKLPEGMSLAEIAREVELLAGIRTAREQAHRGEGVSAEEGHKLVDSWVLK